MYVDFAIFNGKVRIVGSIGFPEIMDRDEAIEKAHALDMNLVQISYNKGQYPAAVCKVIDYSKYKYEQKKREKEAKRASKQAEAKQLVFSIRIDEGDKKVKLEHARKFLAEDCVRVQIGIKLARREMKVKSLAEDLMKELVAGLTDVGMLDKAPAWLGNMFSCTFKPVKKGNS